MQLMSISSGVKIRYNYNNDFTKICITQAIPEIKIPLKSG